MGSENTIKPEKKAYPNPVRGIPIIIVIAMLMSEEYNGYDTLGRNLLQGNINSENTSIDITDLSEDCYFLNIGERLKQVLLIE